MLLGTCCAMYAPKVLKKQSSEHERAYTALFIY